MFEWKNKEVKEEEIEVRLNGMLGKNIWGVHHVVHYGLRQPPLPTFFVQEVLVSALELSDLLYKEDDFQCAKANAGGTVCGVTKLQASYQ